MQLIIPQVELVTDAQIMSVKGRASAPILDFGIGEKCLNELKRGIVSNYRHQYPGVVLLLFL